MRHPQQSKNRQARSLVTVRHFEKWWKEKVKQDPHYLDFSLELVTKDNFNKIQEQETKNSIFAHCFKIGIKDGKTHIEEV